MDDITIGEGLQQKYTQPYLIDQVQKRLYATYNTPGGKRRGHGEAALLHPDLVYLWFGLC